MTGLSFDEALSAARDHYLPASLAHAENVARVAAELADSYGVDAEAARLAGLLHDWARDLGPDRLVEAAADFGLPVSDLDREVPYLLHARVGERQVRATFPDVRPDIVDAIGAHTCGAGQMEDLAKVVYVADMIEPARDFSAVGALRDVVGKVPLDELFRRAYETSVEHLIATRRHIHPDTVAVWNAHIAGRTGS